MKKIQFLVSFMLAMLTWSISNASPPISPTSNNGVKENLKYTSTDVIQHDHGPDCPISHSFNEFATNQDFFCRTTNKNISATTKKVNFTAGKNEVQDVQPGGAAVPTDEITVNGDDSDSTPIFTTAAFQSSFFQDTGQSFRLE